MRTPAGVECAFFYEDFHRGRAVSTCRVQRSSRSARWTEDDCVACPIPSVLAANGSPHLDLSLTVKRGWFGFGKRYSVEARCRKHEVNIEDPRLGCPVCAAGMLDGIDLDLEGPDV